jgi:hypothetical protein
MQEKTRKLEENARMVGLKINAKKTVAIITSTDDMTHPCLTPDFTRKLVSASEDGT